MKRLAFATLAAVVALPLVGIATAGAATSGSWLALGDSYASGEGIPGTTTAPDSQGRDCRRATGEGTDATAWAAGAYKSVRSSLGLERIAFVACTGAITDDAAAQIVEAEQSAVTRWNVATFSFGGNNIKFDEVLKGCIDLNSGWGAFDLTPGCDIDEARLKRRVDMLVAKSPIDAGEFKGKLTLPRLYDIVADHMAPGGDVVVAGYPNLVEEFARWDYWRRNAIGNCESIQGYDVAMLRSAAGYLNEQIAIAVKSADERHRASGVRFHFVDLVRDPYEYSGNASDRHALCTSDPWLNGVTTGVTSGDWRVERSFHPHQIGHTNTARVVADYVRKNVTFADASVNVCPKRAVACDIVSADADGDGKTDKVVLYGLPGADMGTARLKILWGGGDTSTDVEASDTWDDEFKVLSLLGAADMNGDGDAEIIAITGGGAHLRFGKWWSIAPGRKLGPIGDGDFTVDGSYSSNIGTACRDVDGDGKRELISLSAILKEAEPTEVYDVLEVIYRWSGDALVEMSRRNSEAGEPPEESAGVHCTGFKVYSDT